MLEILKYVIPALVVLGASYLTIKQMHDRELSHRKIDLALGNQKIITPMRMAAIERIVLFLERITPESIVGRVLQPNMTCIELQMALLTTIRAEFEHNLSQQIYVSEKSWEAVKAAKESMLQLINTVAQRFENTAKASEMGTMMIQMYAQVEETPLENALLVVKSEVAQILN